MDTKSTKRLMGLALFVSACLIMVPDVARAGSHGIPSVPWPPVIRPTVPAPTPQPLPALLVPEGWQLMDTWYASDTPKITHGMLTHGATYLYRDLTGQEHWIHLTFGAGDAAPQPTPRTRESY